MVKAMPEKSKNSSSQFLDSAENVIKQSEGLPPVKSWNPPLSGDLDMRITRDGAWHYEGSVIGRPAIVRLFSRILRLDDDACFYLVTPVEKWRIQVELAPFVAESVEVEGRGAEQVLRFVTNVGETVTADRACAIRVEVNPDSGEPTPFIHVRDGLDALLNRSVFYQLAEVAIEKKQGDRPVYGIVSAGEFFALA